MNYEPAHLHTLGPIGVNHHLTQAHTQSAYICIHVHIHMHAHKIYNTDMVVPADGD
jgi:hypothetical protein